MATQNELYVMEDYGKKKPFASFLPGISGVHGIPIWCFYVNRGQGVVSFGVNNKNNSIMEFYPAHQAYQNVKTTGFRTFIKKEGKVWEPFAEETVKHSMKIGMNMFEIEEVNSESGLTTTVDYFTLPGEKIGALVRKVTVTNTSAGSEKVEILDGMPAVITSGVDLALVKDMLQTSKAWMQVEDVASGVPYFKVRASVQDTTSVQAIKDGNFSYAILSDGTALPVLVDPSLVFDYDLSLRRAVGFENHSAAELKAMTQKCDNQVPCSFFLAEKELAAGESVSIYEMVGYVSEKNILKNYMGGGKDVAYFEAKKAEALKLTEELVKRIDTHTGSETFDAYTRYTYMDNLLRGGYPMQLGKNKIFYVYSRKHGDLERDYNFFSMLPEFYSQGNGNFRDVNQNRRCDTFFAPFVGRTNIKTFYSLLQLDGYNPLGVEMLTYHLTPAQAEAYLPELHDFLKAPFTPGSLYKKLDEVYEGMIPDQLFDRIIDEADGLVNGNFGEGYWSDHWTYNLDLIEDYLEVFPEEEKDLLFENDYTCFLSQVNVNPRAKRYAVTDLGLRQYHCLDEENMRKTREKLVRTDFQKGDVLKMTLIEKMLLLSATKFANLDAYGMGVEMEGGKPGWYDALNGLPGLFGSSMCETYELDRMLAYVCEVLKKYPGKIQILKETADFMKKLSDINKAFQADIHACDCLSAEEIKNQGQVLAYWNAINDAKEAYRAEVFKGVSGEKCPMDTDELSEIFEGFLDTVDCGVRKANILGDGIAPAYFSYHVPEYNCTEAGIEPLKFVVDIVPYFLEGPVRYLKLKNCKEKKTALYSKVKNSDLYDQKLSMYKVNAPLAEVSFEFGRARAFTPGWLENESIWLHMEYKYLLELLRSGMYAEFFEDFHKAAVPFLNPETYGRSVLENSSFIASSANPDPSIHGKGFVARLSGSTIEFMSMWKLMMFGSHVMTYKNKELQFAPQPAIPAYLIPEDGKVSATLFGNTEVVYQFPYVDDFMPGKYQIRSMSFEYRNGSVASVASGVACSQIAKSVRDGQVKKITVEIA